MVVVVVVVVVVALIVFIFVQTVFVVIVCCLLYVNTMAFLKSIFYAFLIFCVVSVFGFVWFLYFICVSNL